MNFRLLFPELIWLEPEQLKQAQAISAVASTEAQRWQSYLTALALLGFERWLSERLSERSIRRLSKPIKSVSYIEVNGFTICLIAVEHLLDETVRIPQAAVEQPALTAHFYVLHEVSEEQELITVRGFCRYDELIDYRNRYPYQTQDGYYQFPLAVLDAEPNHLLFYCRFLQPSAIALPISAAPVPERLLVTTSPITKLTLWLQDAFDQNWQTIDQLMNPDAYLALSSRSLGAGVRRGKLLNLGVQLGQQAVALLVNVTSEAEGKVGVLVQLHPTGTARYLCPDLKLSLRSAAGRILQEVTSRGQDNYIQLKSFRGEPGNRFNVVIHLGSDGVEEYFEL